MATLHPMRIADAPPPVLVQGGLFALAAVVYGVQLAAGLPRLVRAAALVAAALGFVVGGARDHAVGDHVNAAAWLVSAIAIASLAAAAATGEGTFATAGFGLLLLGGAGLFARNLRLG